MITQVNIRHIVFSAFCHNQNAVFGVELTQAFAASVVIQSQHIGIEPHFAAAQCGAALLLQRNFEDIVFGQNISHGLTAFDGYLSKIFFELQFPDSGSRLEGNTDNFGLAIRIGAEILNTRTRGAFGQIVFLISGYAAHGKTLDIGNASSLVVEFAVAVNNIVDGAGIVFLKNIQVKHVFADKHLVAYLDHLVLAVFVKKNDIVQIGTGTNQFVFFEGSTNKTFFAVDV